MFYYPGVNTDDFSFWERNSGSGSLFPKNISDNVGIGKDNPGEKLDVLGSFNVQLDQLELSVTNPGLGAEFQAKSQSLTSVRAININSSALTLSNVTNTLPLRGSIQNLDLNRNTIEYNSFGRTNAVQFDTNGIFLRHFNTGINDYETTMDFSDGLIIAKSSIPANSYDTILRLLEDRAIIGLNDPNALPGTTDLMSIEISTGIDDQIRFKKDVNNLMLLKSNSEFSIFQTSGSKKFEIGITGQILTNQFDGNNTIGAQVDRFPIYDPSGSLIGYVPVYAA